MSIFNPENTPKCPGVYIFQRDKTPIYIGKAANLKKRLSSYFRKNSGGKTARLLNEANRVEWIELQSEVEALVKEAELIKKYQPKYNYLLRDDKNYFYVETTKEEYPKVFITHQPLTGSRNKELGIRAKNKIPNSKFLIHNSSFIGPFTSGSALKAVLKVLRKTFPYCICKKPHKRSCLSAEIGRCPGFCCIISKSQSANRKAQDEYRLNIQKIIAVLTGRSGKLIRELKHQMRRASKDQRFEEAAKLRDQIENIENIFKHRIFLEEPRRPKHEWRKIERTLKQLLKTHKDISRVEGYDISNISGSAATGSMVVFTQGRPEKSEYRKFKIRTVSGISDVDMLKEVIARRILHTEWRSPDLALIDGGKPQLNAARSVIINNQLSMIDFVSLAKKEEELYIPGKMSPLRISSLPIHTAHFLQHVRDESHRFAKKYHHKLRGKLYRE